MFHSHLAVLKRCFGLGIINNMKSKINTSNLAKLRKKTGFSLSLCKKALENSNQDVLKAEEWINKHAHSLGWDKAQKLEGRNTTQGLVGVGIQTNQAVMIEINCETDFVSRNKEFHNLLYQSVRSLLDMPRLSTELFMPCRNRYLSIAQLTCSNLSSIPNSQTETNLGDLVALTIGRLGENIVLQRGIVFIKDEASNIMFSGTTHPLKIINSSIHYGRYGSLLAFSRVMQSYVDNNELTDFLRHLGQHVIGMNPSQIGHDDNDAEAETSSSQKTEDLLSQSFLMDESKSLKEVLNEYGLKIEDFIRYEIGQNKASSSENLFSPDISKIQII